MPLYEYKALNRSGKELKGIIDADNERSARSKLRYQGLLPTQINIGKHSQTSVKKDLKLLFSPKEKVSLKVLCSMTRQLATLINAGIPLVDTLQAASDQTEHQVMQRILVQLRESVEEGNSFSKSLRTFPNTFPNLYISMIASGEASGTLDKVLANLADYLDSQIEMRRKVTSALLYPSLMLMFCTLVVAGLLAFVVPKIVSIFQKQGAVLPLPTRIMIVISDFIINYWYVLIFIVVFLVYSVRLYHRKPEGRKKIDSLLLKLPAFRKTYQKVFTAQVSRTLGSLLSSGVGLLQALDIVKNTVNNIHVRQSVEEAKEGVREGRSLAKELSKSGIFPKILSHMVAIGEKSGKLDQMLTRAGNTFEKEVSNSLNNISSIIQPVMIIAVGCVVFIIVISILMPMVSLMDIIQG
jgi:general secretion pathway protein F